MATNWLDGAIGSGSDGLKVPLYVKRSVAFRPPADLAPPVIMIGPGTGVAPFRAFLERRRVQTKKEGGAAGPAWQGGH